MIKLQNIYAKLLKPISANSQKHIRVSFANTVKASSKCAVIKNGQSLQWLESITIPIEHSKQIMFEIYERHEFGYNPEQLEGVLGGKLVLNSVQKTKGVWDIKDNKKETVGFLQAIINQIIPDKIDPVQDLQQAAAGHNLELSNQIRTISIRSIVVKLMNKSIKKGVIQVEIGGNKVRSSELRHRNGQLACVRFDCLNFEESKKYGSIKLLELVNGQQRVVGIANLELFVNGCFHRLNLMNQGIKIGFLILESSIIERTNKSVSEMIQNRERVGGHSSVLKQYLNSQIKRNSLEENNSLIDSRFSIASDPFQINWRSKKYTRQSVVNNNANIKFSQQKRFTDYQDKPNPKITYLSNNNMQFRSASSGKFYRGAGFGFGCKTDFTQESKKNPGVGDYKLPTIWDKY